MTTAFILAAGKGERLWPFSTVLPKCLWPVGGKPCVRLIAEKIQQDLLRPLGIGSYPLRVCIVCLRKDLPLFSHEFRDMNVDMIPVPEPTGTAGAVAEAVRRLDLPREGEDELLVHYGDCLIGADYSKLLDAHRSSKGCATLLLTSGARSEYGRAVMAGPNPGEILSFDEKPVLGFPTWTGVAVLNRMAYGHCDIGKDIAVDVFPRLMKMQLTITGYEVSSPYYDIGSYRSYATVNDLATEGKLFQ